MSPAASAAFTACSASQVGVLMLEGTLASSRASQLAPAAATACPRCAVRASSDAVSASTILPTGRSRGPSWCIEKPKEPSVAPATKAVIASSSPTAATEEATASAFRVCRATVAPARRTSVSVASPTPTRSTLARSGLTGADSGSADRATGSSVTSPVAPVARALSSTDRKSMPRSSASSAEPGPSVGPSSPRRTGTATTATPRTREGACSLRANSGGETWVGRDTQRP